MYDRKGPIFSSFCRRKISTKFRKPTLDFLVEDGANFVCKRKEIIYSREMAHKAVPCPTTGNVQNKFKFNAVCVCVHLLHVYIGILLGALVR